MTSFANSLNLKRSLVEQALQQYLAPRLPEQLWEAMAYSALGSGKRIRGVLVLAAAEALSPGLQTNPAVLATACAFEAIHTQSLIHDDLPCMDDDDWRRGKLSNHKVYGEALAIIAGDALLAYAFQLVAQSPIPPAQAPRLLEVIAEMAAATGGEGMCGGQTLDMLAEGRDQLSLAEVEQIYHLKTGRLLRGAVRCGAMIGGATPEQLQALTIYSENLGLAFQLVDDILDITASFENLGKTPRKDMQRKHHTYPQQLGIPAARERTRQCIAHALAALEGLGTPAPFLGEIAQYLLEREK